MFLLIHLINFYFGHTTIEESASSNGFFKMLGTGLIAAFFAVIGFRIRDWFDEYKEIKKDNIKFINLYEELKELNEKLNKVHADFEGLATKLKTAMLGSVNMQKRVYIGSIERIDSIDKEFFFRRLILYSTNIENSVRTYRELLNNIKILRLNIDKAYETYETYAKSYLEESKIFAEKFEEFKTFIINEINSDYSNNPTLDKFNTLYVNYSKSDRGSMKSMELIDAIKDLINFNTNPNIKDEKHRLIFDCMGRFNKMQFISIETMDYFTSASVNLNEIHKKLKSVEENLNLAIRSQFITVKVSILTFLSMKISEIFKN